MKMILLILLGAITAHAEVGFKKGNNLTVVISQGQIAIHCQGGAVAGPIFRSILCQHDVLLTGEYDHFQGPQGVVANEVTLTALHQDGSQQTTTVGYNSNLGLSSKKINLWIASFFQGQLLDLGTNRISYTMFKDSLTVAQGEFLVEVKDGGVRSCSRRAIYWSGNSNDCQSGGTFCFQYFRENNYCL